MTIEGIRGTTRLQGTANALGFRLQTGISMIKKLGPGGWLPVGRRPGAVIGTRAKAVLTVENG